jgi:hypothetical protein
MLDQATHAALNFPLTRIAARYQQLYDVSTHDLLRRERELKRYLVLRSRLRTSTLPTPKVLDQLWHVFLLYTRDYMDFCDILGGGFIHHVPSESSPPVEEVAERYREMLAEYEELFREEPPGDVWPMLDASGRFDDSDMARTSELGDCDSAIEAV